MIKKVISILVACVFALNTIALADSNLQPPLSSWAPSDTISVEAAIVAFLKGLNCPISEIDIDPYVLVIGKERVHLSFHEKQKNGENWILPCHTVSGKYEAVIKPHGDVVVRKIDDKPTEPDWQTQERLQTVSQQDFSYLSLGQALVFWCGGTGFHVNPSPDDLTLLEAVGVSPNNIDYLIITDSRFAAYDALLKRILSRERIKIIATDEIFRDIIAKTSEILGSASDVRDWVDFLPLDLSKPAIIQTGGGEIKIGIDLKIHYRDKTLDLENRKTDIFGSEVFIKRPEEDQLNWLMGFLEDVSLLAHLDKKDRELVAKKSGVLSFKPGETVLLKGDAADAAYIVISGKAEVVENEKSIWPFESLDFFGEVGLQTNQTRNATIKAKTFLKVLRIDKDLYNGIVYNPLRGMEAFNQAKWNLEKWIKTISPGVTISGTSLDEIVLRAKREVFRGIKEGERGDSAYILMKGRVNVVKKDPKGHKVTIRSLEPFQLFGEMALMSPSSIRTASVEPADKEVVVLKISRELFEFILNKYPGLDKGIKEDIIKRRRQARESLTQIRKVSTPPYLVEGYTESAGQSDIILRFRSFLDNLKIAFIVEGISSNELGNYAHKFRVIHGILDDIFGSSRLERGYLRAIHITSSGERSGYLPEEGILMIPRALFDSETPLFTAGVLDSLNEALLYYLSKEEFLDAENVALQDAVETIKKDRERFKGTFLEKELSAEMLAALLRIYIVKPDELRELLQPEAPLEASLKIAIETIYRVYKDVAFLGKEYTRKRPTTGIMRRKPDTTRIEAKEWNASKIAKALEDTINHVLNNYIAVDTSLFRQEFYEEETYRKLKLALIGKLSDEFTYFHLQRFYDDLIEISVYDAKSKTRIVARARRIREKKLFKWKIEPFSDEKAAVAVIERLDHPPLNIDLVNLESPQFGGVKGTPENVKTLQAYLETHRKNTVSISLFDCQWPENNVDFLLKQLEAHTPNILAISATFGCRRELEKLLNGLNALKHRPMVVVGGLMSTWSYEYILEKYPDVVCVRYEGEEAFTKIADLAAKVPARNIRDVIASKLPEIPNLAFIENGQIRTIAKEFVDLEKVPPPSRDTQLRRQMQAKWLLNSEGIGRGCGYGGCFFCTRTHGKLRRFPLERGLADFKAYMEGGAPFVVYVDEDFMLDEAFAKHVIGLREEYRQRRIESGESSPQLPSFYIALRANTVFVEGDEVGNQKRLEALRLFKKAGLVKIFLGGESGSPVQFHKTYNKGASIPEVEKAIQIIKGEGIQVVVGFITFDPVVTLNQLRENVDFMERNGLVDVDPLTEPLNPFKYYRAQVASTLTRKLSELGFLASSQDPDSLMYDTVYRNPLVRVITGVGDAWKGASDELEYHLKGVIWYAEQSEEEMEKAALFVGLFNALRKEAFHLVKNLIELEEKRLSGINEGKKIEEFISSLYNLSEEGIFSALPEEKVLFEAERVMFPHHDMFAAMRNYAAAHKGDSGFDLYLFITAFLKGKFPEDFSFGRSSRDEYRLWLKDVRADICQGMMSLAEQEEYISFSEKILRDSLARRKEILEAFARSSWKDYYEEYPEAVARGRDFQKVLNATLTEHERLLASPGESLLTKQVLSTQPYRIFWRASLDEFLSYRHPDLSVPLNVLIEVFREIQRNPTKYSLDPQNIFVYKDLRLKFKTSSKEMDVMEFAEKCIGKLFIHGADVNAEYFDSLLEIYQAIKHRDHKNIDQLIRELLTLYNRAAQRRTLVSGETDIETSPVTLDGYSAIELVTDGKEKVFSIRGSFVPALLKINFKGERQLLTLCGDILRSQINLSEQERFNIINALVEIFSKDEEAEKWMDDLASLVDRSISPLTIYLPDKDEYLDWPKKYPDIKFIYVHPRLYEKIWPGIESHLEKIIMLARAHVFDNFESVLQKVKEGEITPAWMEFIYEAFFNRINAEAFSANENPQEVITQYTTISRRVMPKKTPVILLNNNDRRLEIFPSHHENVNNFMQKGDKVRFVVHPQVYDHWKKTKDNMPFEKESFEWALVYPTASCRTLYVLNGDIIAKAHSLIRVGPAIRRLKRDNVTHSVKISERICGTIDRKELPPNIQEEFAYSSESGLVLNDPEYYEEGIGVIYRDTASYPIVKDEERILIPAFSFHNNSISIDENSMPDVLIELIRHNTSKTGEDEVEFFVRTFLRPLYRMFDYFIFKQGILLEPHGQNFFIEVDLEGRPKRLVFKDWQSTMVDMETIIRRELLKTDIQKHLLGKEASTPLSLSLVIDHYFGHYLFEKIIDTLSEEYHGSMSEVEYRERLIARFKEVFEEELGLYRDHAGNFPDFYVRHDNEEKRRDDERRKRDALPPSNQVFFKTDGPPEFRPTDFERGILRAIEDGRSRGSLEIKLKSIEDETAEVTITDEAPIVKLDFERTTFVTKGNGAYFKILPPDFDPGKEYPLVILLHGMTSSVMDLTSWVENINIKDAVVIIPFGPVVTDGTKYSWFVSNDSPNMMKEKKASLAYLEKIASELKKEINVDKCVIGGLSQGGHMALFAFLAAPDTFDHVFTINAPFKEAYLEGADFPPLNREKKKALILHIENDEIVNVSHSERERNFLERGGLFPAEKLYSRGVHHKISPAMAEDISTWLGELSKRSIRGKIALPLLDTIKRLAERSRESSEDATRLSKIIFEIGERRSKGYESILYDILLDTAYPFDLRCESLNALEKLKFPAVSENAGQVQFISRVQEAKYKLATIERTIAFLTAAIASRDEIPSEMLNDFYCLISSFRRINYSFKRCVSRPEDQNKKGKITGVLDQAEWLYAHTLNLQRAAIELLLKGKKEAPADSAASPIVRVLTDPEQLALNLVEGLISLKLNKEVVLIFDANLAVNQAGEPLSRFLRALEVLKKNEKYKKILGNIKIEISLPEKMEEKIAPHAAKKDTEIFVFAPEVDRKKLNTVEQKAHTVYVDESEFKTMAYYPLAEIVVIALAESILPSIIDNRTITILQANGVELKLSDLNINSITRDTTALVFKLLPNAEEHSLEEIIRRSAELNRFLKSA